MSKAGRSLFVHFRSLTTAFLAVLIALWCFVPASGADGWSQVQSKNFFVIGDVGAGELSRTAGRLEQFREAVRQMFPQLKLDGGVRTNVVVFKDAAAYAPFKPKRPDGSIDSSVTGFFVAGEDVNYITLAVSEKAGAFGTVFHEYIHFLLDTNIGRSDLPPWLGEGLAEYFETFQFVDDQRVMVGSPPPGHLALLRQNGLIPFSAFLAATNASVHRGTGESRTLFYAQSWALMHYSFHSGKRPAGRLDELLTSLAGAHSSSEAFEKLFGNDGRSVETALLEYISHPLPANRIFPIVSNPGPEATAFPLSAAEADAYLGDLLLRSNRTGEAEVYLRKALKQEPGLSLANSSLGLLLVKTRKFAEAKAFFERAIAAKTATYFTHFNYAYSLSQESVDDGGRIREFPSEAADRMRREIRRAIELNPDFAESYRLLALIEFVNNGSLTAATDLLNKGLLLRPGDQDLSLLLAQVLLRQERYDEAGKIAEQLVAGAAKPEIWSEAKLVLETVDQFNAAQAANTEKAGAAARIFGPLPPLILKRSAISAEDVAAYDKDRQITNLNLLIDRPRFGEKQITGYVEKMTCRDGEIAYSIRSAGGVFTLTSPGFGAVGLRVLTDGMRTFTLACGQGFGDQLTLITFLQTEGDRPDDRGRLVSIAFVPDYFRLKTPREMAATRTVIVEDDRIFKAPKIDP